MEKVKEVAKEWFGENPEDSPDLCRVVSDRHFDRLESLISSSTGRIAFGKYLELSHMFFYVTSNTSCNIHINIQIEFYSLVVLQI